MVSETYRKCVARVSCSQCGALPGVPCHNDFGREWKAGVHAVRRAAHRRWMHEHTVRLVLTDEELLFLSMSLQLAIDQHCDTRNIFDSNAELDAACALAERIDPCPKPARKLEPAS